MAISAKDVMELRKRTGMGMMECKKALGEAEGDIDKAVEELRKAGLIKAGKRSEKEALEGRIAVASNEDRSLGAIVEINSETDFTAGNDVFKDMAEKVAKLALEAGPGEVEKTEAMQAAIDEVRLTTKENIQFRRARTLGGAGKKVGVYQHFTGKVGAIVEVTGEADEALLLDLAMHVAATPTPPVAVRPEDVPEDVVTKEREIAKAQALESGKPENIAEKMVEGKIRKFYEEVVLPKQPFIKEEKKRVEQLLPSGSTISNFARFEVGGA